MKLKRWKAIGRCSIDENSLLKTIVRESFSRIPNNNARRSFPAIKMIVTNQHSVTGISKVFNDNCEVPKYEIYLEDSEYSIKTSYGNSFNSLEQAKFVADLKLIELDYEIEEPFLLEAKVSRRKNNGTIDDEDCYFTCIACDLPARKVDNGKCIECYNEEFDRERKKSKAKPHIDRFLANDPVDW